MYNNKEEKSTLKRDTIAMLAALAVLFISPIAITAYEKITYEPPVIEDTATPSNATSSDAIAADELEKESEISTEVIEVGSDAEGDIGVEVTETEAVTE